jgi:Lar family restriction alleviation protein
MKLKPCPFCGGKGKVRRLEAEAPNPYYVMCDDCGAATDWEESGDAAETRWQRRCAPLSPDTARPCFENGRYAHEGD